MTSIKKYRINKLIKKYNINNNFTKEQYDLYYEDLVNKTKIITKEYLENYSHNEDEKIETIGTIFNMLIKENKIIKAGEFYTPILLIDKILEICKIEDNSTIFEPSAGTGNIVYSILKKYNNVNIVANEYNKHILELLKENLKEYNNNIKYTNLDGSNSIDSYDYIIANPPYSIVPHESVFVENLLKKCNKKAIFILPKSFLYSKEFKNIRDTQIGNHLSKIIEIPSNIFDTTTIPTLAIEFDLQFKYHSFEYIKLINKNLDIKFRKIISISEYLENDKNLNSLLYDESEEEKKEFNLEEIFEEINIEEIINENMNFLKSIEKLKDLNGLKIKDVLELKENGKIKSSEKIEEEKISEEYEVYYNMSIKQDKNKYCLKENNDIYLKENTYYLLTAGKYEIYLNKDKKGIISSTLKEIKFKEEYKEYIDLIVFYFNNYEFLYNKENYVKSKKDCAKNIDLNIFLNHTIDYDNLILELNESLEEFKIELNEIKELIDISNNIFNKINKIKD